MIIDCAGEAGNAYAIMGIVSELIRDEHGRDAQEIVDEYVKVAMSGDYNNLIEASLKYSDIEFINIPPRNRG